MKEKPNEENNIKANKFAGKNFYYNCSLCQYSSSKISHYKRHLQSFHIEEYKWFINSEIKKNKKTVTVICKKRDILLDKNEIKDDYDFENKRESEQKKNSLNLNDYKNLLRNAYDYSDHLNKLDFHISDYYRLSNKIISSGAFSTSYLGEDSKSGLKVIILKTDIKYEEEISLEKYILNKIKGFGNFPPLYDTLVDDENIYLIEGFMGFDLHTLFKKMWSWFQYNHCDEYRNWAFGKY